MQGRRNRNTLHKMKTLTSLQGLASEYGLTQQEPSDTAETQNVGYRQGSAEVDLKPELDLHGYRVKSALSEVDSTLNRATLSGLDKIKIIHGKGTGALRTAVREHLENHPMVERWMPDPDYDEAEGAVQVIIAK